MPGATSLGGMSSQFINDMCVPFFKMRRYDGIQNSAIIAIMHVESGRMCLAPEIGLDYIYGVKAFEKYNCYKPIDVY